MYRAGGIADSAFGMLADFFYRFYRDADITHIVQRVENTEYVHAVVGRGFDERAYHVVRIMTVAQQVLSAQQHLDAAVRQCLTQFFQAFPGVFFQVAHAGVKSRATPRLYRPEAYVVQFCADGQHVFSTHPRGNYGLMTIT